MKKRHSLNGKKISIIVLIILLSALIIKIMIKTLPHTIDKLQNAAIFSAGFVLPEGGANLFNKNLMTLLNKDYTRDSSEVSNNESSDKNDVKEQPYNPETKVEENSTGQEETPPENSGPLLRQYFGGGTSDSFIKLLNNAYIKNTTKISRDIILSASKSPPAFKIESTDAPQVLIMHTHATESYEPSIRNYYDKSYNSRTKDNEKNVVRVGKEIADQLKKAKIGVIQDTTQHDNPSYNGSYERSEVTVKTYLKKYPSIKVVLDVHRDAIQQEDGTRIAPVANIDGKNAAQLMIISGADDGTMGYPNYLENLKFSSKIQEQIEKDYKGLTRPILFSYRKYNQHLTNGSMLLEMGAHGNSLDEAIYAGELVGKSIAKVLNNLK